MYWDFDRMASTVASAISIEILHFSFDLFDLFYCMTHVGSDLSWP
jgi:hypothetical protein